MKQLYTILVLCGLLSACGPKTTFIEVTEAPSVTPRPKFAGVECVPTLDKSRIKTVEIGDGFTEFDSGSKSELIGCLPTHWPLVNGQFEKYPIYQVTLTNVKAGDYLVAWSEMEVTNDMKVPMMFAGVLRVYVDGKFQEISEANGYNVTPEMHHGDQSKQGSLTFTKDLSKVDVVLVAYSATTGVKRGSLTVEPDAGRLQGFVYRENKDVPAPTPTPKPRKCERKGKCK